MTMVNPAISGYEEKHDATNGVDGGIDNFYSSLQRSRLDYVPPKPSVLQGEILNFLLRLNSGELSEYFSFFDGELFEYMSS